MDLSAAALTATNMDLFSAIDQTLVVPELHKTVPVDSGSGRKIYELITEHKLTRTLETGLGYGKAAAYAISATKRTHIAIDPFQHEWGEQGVENIRRLGLSSHLDLRRDFSHFVLPKLAQEGQKIDFAFVDGDHKFDFAFVDFYFIDKMLELGGFVMFHDTWMRSIAMLESFIAKNRKDYVRKKSDCGSAIFQKVGDDDRDWTHFREFFTAKSLLKSWMIMRKIRRENLVTIGQ